MSLYWPTLNDGVSLHGAFQRDAGSKPCALNNSSTAADVSNVKRVRAVLACLIVSRLSLLAGTFLASHACELSPEARPRQRYVALHSFPLGSATLRLAAASET
jgi:hypothetical protein